jgi:23S rRNA (guanine745-N1)-methyltransferase
VFEERQAVCSNNHRFDQARQGYFNLMSANRKGSKEPGDTREMMLARRSFLEQGHYKPLLNGLVEWLSGKEGDEVSLLDSGCGEGYYLQQLLHSDPTRLRAHGLDISKEAVKLAARSNPEIQWVVASSFQLPVISASVDVVLRIFAPGSDEEVHRVLSENGELWRVAPAADHLQELKALLYDRVQTHAEPETPSGFELIEQKRVTSICTLEAQEAVHQLLTMTPFVWQAPKQKQEQVLGLDKLDVTADFLLQRYRVSQ